MMGSKDEEDARRLAEQWTPEAVETLYDIMRNPKNAAATRLAAANQIIAISGILTHTTTAAAVTTTGG